MKLARKKLPKGNLLLMFSFLAISFCCLLIIATARTGRINSLGQNGLCSGKQRNFSVKDAEEETLWQDIIPQLREQNENFSIYVPIPDPQITIKGLCTTGRAEAPPMLQGRYFDFASSWSGHLSAVLGKDYLGQAEECSGKLYYRYGGIEFEIIGIMGTEWESRINHMVIVDFQSALSFTGINTSYVLDGRKESDILAAGQDICSLFRPPAYVTVILEQAEEPTLLARFLSGNAIMDTMYAMALACFSLSTILTTVIWLRFRQQLFFAWRLCGAKRLWQYLETAEYYFQAAGCGFLAGLALAAAFCQAMPDIQITVTDTLLSLAMTMCLGWAILTVSKFTGK